MNVTLIDVNDNRPVFQNNIYFTSTNHYAAFVSENATTGTFVLMVLATDADTGSFGAVSYSFLNPSSKEGLVGTCKINIIMLLCHLWYSVGLFYINETSGFISVLGTLDSEQQSQINLTVVARDGGSPPQVQNVSESCHWYFIIIPDTPNIIGSGHHICNWNQ